MRSRDIIRHNMKRMKQKALDLVKNKNLGFVDKIYAEKWAVKNADHLANCSCSECGNPRKHLKEITKQEIVNNINFKEEIDEL